MLEYLKESPMVAVLRAPTAEVAEAGAQLARGPAYLRSLRGPFPDVPPPRR